MRGPLRELIQVGTMWFGFGEPPPSEAPEARRDIRYLIVQTVAAIVLGALVAALRSGISDRPLPAAFPASYLLLALPLTIAVARHPREAPVPLAGALPAGAVVVVIALVLLQVSGFWWWFGVMSAAALVAGVVFGALRGGR